MSHNNRPQSASLELTGKAYKEFVSGIRSVETREIYVMHLRKFLSWLKLDSPDDLLKQDSKLIQEQLRDNLLELKAQGLSYSSRKSRYSAMKKFLESNEITLNWKKIAASLGEELRVAEDRPYTTDEIQTLVDKADLRLKVVILLMASSGVRIGAIPGITRRHLTWIEDFELYSIKVYARSREEYTTFCTPECAKYINEYFELRGRYGETLNDNSPLIREQFNRQDMTKSPFARPIHKDTLSRRIESLLIDSGVRDARPRLEGKMCNPRREVMASHGLRKFFDTSLETAGANPVVVEKLMGHDIGLKGSYYRPLLKDLLAEYVKGLDALTIDPANRLEKKVSELQQKIKDAPTIEMLKDTVANLSDSYVKLLEEVRKMKNEVDH